LISVSQIHDKALRLWNSGKVLQNLQGLNDIFPVKIPAGKPAAAKLMDNFAEAANWIEELRRNSTEHHATGYRLQMAEINHRSLGKQTVPQYVVFDDATHLIAFIQKQQESDFFHQQLANIRARLPELADWCLQNPIKVIEQQKTWSRLIEIVCHFRKYPEPNCYIRELEIEGIDSKFIEQHRGTLSPLLDAVLDPAQVDLEVTGLARHGFERRFGLKYDPPIIRFRCLHDEIKQQFGGIADISLPLSEFIQLRPSWSRVFITENKVNGLSFPSLCDSIVIFGLGYGISMLEHVAWLTDCEVTYWGDIDTHGLSILSTIKGFHPHTKSMLMDEITLLKFKRFWGKEPESKRFTGTLQHLNPQEQSLYVSLTNDVHGNCIRLEQERIGFQWLLEQLSKANDFAVDS
jgi:hypothetical protein